MYLYFFKAFLFAFFLLGCSVDIPHRLPYHSLSQALDKNITKKERDTLAKDIYQKTQILSKAFKLVSPPAYHNFLVNIGAREKGLCYDWADALYRHLISQNYASFDFHLMGANIGEYWSEHNVLLVVAKDKPLDQGIIIDPWRNSGKIFFAKVKEDKNYTWKHRPKRCKIIGGDKFYR